eukprot:gene19157-biopygen20507
MTYAHGSSRISGSHNTVCERSTHAVQRERNLPAVSAVAPPPPPERCVRALRVAPAASPRRARGRERGREKCYVGQLTGECFPSTNGGGSPASPAWEVATSFR